MPKKTNEVRRSQKKYGVAQISKYKEMLTKQKQGDYLQEINLPLLLSDILMYQQKNLCKYYQNRLKGNNN